MLKLLFVALINNKKKNAKKKTTKMLICTKKKEKPIKKMFVLSDLLDVAIISLPRSISRLAAGCVCARARVCACLSVCLLWPEHLGLFFSFSDNESASVNLKSLHDFVLKVFHQVASNCRLAAAPLRCALHFIPSGSCSRMSTLGFVRSCECVHDMCMYETH